MVSDDTRDRTQDMLEKGGWFGMEEGQVTLMKQEKVAALEVSAHKCIPGYTFHMSNIPRSRQCVWGGR